MPGALRRSKSHLLVALGVLLCVACGRHHTRPIVSSFDLSEARQPREVDEAPIVDGLATGEEYDPSVLSRDLERVERYYRARGYYEAKVTAARVLGRDPTHVGIEIRVDPGEQVLVRDVRPAGLSGLSARLSARVFSALGTLQQGTPLDEARFDEMKANILEALQDRGYPFAKVDAKAHVDLVTHTADIDVKLDPGELSTFGVVKIEGLQAIPERVVRDVLDIAEGKRYSHSDLGEARQAVLKLGVFANVEVREDLTHPETHRVPITLIVRETELRTIRLGGGATFDVLRLNVHLRVGWEHLNFLGGARDLSITATPGVDLFPTRLDGRALRAPTRALLENTIQLKFRQPSFLEARTTGTVDARYDVRPLLYPLPVNADPNKEPIIGYQTVSTQFGLEREWYLPRIKRIRGRVTLAPSLNWQANFPFTYQSSRPDGLVPVTVAYPALTGTIEYRDDPVQTHVGASLSNTIQVADKIFGGSVSDLRIQPELRGFIPITKKSVTLATRLTMGFLIPRDYGQSLSLNNQRTTAPTAADVVTDQEKLLLRAFYSGGPNSNRGYPLRGVGPHGPVGFLIPTGVDCVNDPNNTACIRPLGGFTLWEASLELRFPLIGSLSAVTFADASDVTRDVGHVRLNVPHLSVGPGLRYMTPVGPLRLDVGYRVPGAQAFGKSQLSVEEGRNDVGNLFGLDWLPVAINIAIGEAF
ncbi:MAG: BamA/TamA family outer membrane protein [Polyangiaceae bacterium]